MKCVSKRTSIWSFMVFLHFGSLSQGQMMSSEISAAALTAKAFTDRPELAIDSLQKQILELTGLEVELASCSNFDEKLKIVSENKAVQQFLQENPPLNLVISELPKPHQYAVLVVIALNQGPVIFQGWQNLPDLKASVTALGDKLFAAERFYDYMGGVAGYHVKTLQLIYDQLAKKQDPESAKLLLPPVTDIRAETPARSKMVKDGLHSINQMAEIYVVGGAGDRLALVDEMTKIPLPVARLQFAGYSLIENLVRDLEAREYLAYKLTGKQSTTPIVLMTSHEKNNDAQIAKLLDERAYFGRPKTSIFRLLQPMTPVIAIDGKWAVSGPCDLVLKPGGHGVVWKLADEYGAFDWLKKHDRKYMIVRQINNPLAGLDTNLLALAGYGYANKKGFGFESIPRLPGYSEGMNVLRETAAGKDVACSISNIEYTEFAKARLNDPQFAAIADSPDFPANTNILFADIDRVQGAAKVLPVPGFLVNMKHPVETLRDGQKVTLPGARLESTMQNIADAITNTYSAPVSSKELASLDTFVLLNDRAKTMSVTKKAFDGKSIQETPEGCFYDLMQENIRLLKNHCGFEVAELTPHSDYISNGPSAIFVYHPAVGPVYSLIAKKVSKGSLAAGSELQLEIAEVAISHLDVDGSLIVTADCVTGQINKDGVREFSSDVGRLVLSNVKVKNKGINRTAPNAYYKLRIARDEVCRIQLLGNSECIAKDVVLDGNIDIVVQPNTRAILSQDSRGKLVVKVEDINTPNADSIKWKYALDKDAIGLSV